jgi:hypothetical protein
MARVFTEAERKAGEEAKALRRAEMKLQTKDYKLDWLDEGFWLDLASARHVRLPPMWMPATEASLKKWARKLSKLPFSEHFGCSPKDLILKNPKVPLRAFVGQMLEP